MFGVTPGMTRYEDLLDQLAVALDQRCTQALNIVLIDGIPASGKSSLSRGLAERLRARGRGSCVVENDWFIARNIRNPISIVLGLLMAVSPAGIGVVERRLLDHFLDRRRLGAFQHDLSQAITRLEREPSASLRPQGAFWNLRHPPDWRGTEAARGLTLSRGDIVLIEGTLTRATYLLAFPGLTSLLVHVPVPVARARFMARNRDRRTRRNRAFTALARNEIAFRLAARMLYRNRGAYDFELDFADLTKPVLRSRTPPA